MASHPPKSHALQTNMEVDYVVSYRFANTDRSTAIAQFEKLVRKLADVGLATEVRNGDKHSVLVFVRVASEKHLYGEVYRSRVKDWIYGVRAAAPEKHTRRAIESEPLYEAERLRIIYQLMTNPESEGGAGIMPKEGEWKNVESIFALHDHAYNKEWIKKWTQSWVLKPEDLDAIRDRLGEKIAFYFAFTQSYFTFLLFPAAFGFSAWVLLGHYSALYAIVNGLWCIIFTEYWKHQEVDLAVRWGVRGVSSIESKRKDFRPEKETIDPVTGEKVQIFPATKRLQWQLLQIPFAISAALVLGSLLATCFGIEIFISEIYNGPLKSVLVFLPTGIVTTVLPILTGIFTQFATQLNQYENYETNGAYETALTRKIFVLNFISSYLPIFLTAFVYVPFASLIVPYLDIFSLTVKPFAENEKQLKSPKAGFTINPSRLRKQVIYFTVTAQIVNMGLEVIMPYLKRKGFSKYKQIQSERAAKRGGASMDVAKNDAPEEAEFLARVRQEAELDVYDVTTDLREMVLQFGYLSLFSVVWPLTAVSFLINDWFELRADAIKICVEMQRPVPLRADTIGPWLDSLSFLAWLGSITSAAIVYLFSNDGLGPDGTPYNIRGWALLLTVFFSEHAFFLVRWGVRTAIARTDSPGRQKERRERYLVRKRYVEESLSELGEKPRMGEAMEEISRTSLEEEARRESLHDSRVEDRFWARQRNWRETAQIGARLIEMAAVDEGKKAQYEFYYDVLCRGQYTFKIRRMYEKYDNIVRINPEEVHIADPDYYNEIYAGPLRKRDKWSWFTNYFGIPDSTFATVSHDVHRMRRAALNPFFSKAKVRSLQPQIEGVLEKLMARFEEFKESGEPMTDVFDKISFIQSHRDSSAYKYRPQSTIFHEILNSDLPASERSTSRLWQDGQVTVIAGTLTIASALSVTLFYLLTQPSDLRRLKTELSSAIDDPSRLPPVAALEQLPHLTACIQEGLRLSNGVSSRLQRISPVEPLVFNAKAADGTKTKEYVLPPGMPVSKTGLLNHFSPDVFREPTSFLPQRWLDNPWLDKYLVPFSRGTRQCIGMNLAYAELYLTLAMLFRRYGSSEVRMPDDRGWLELYKTDARDVEIVGDRITPLNPKGSKGVRIVVRK